MSTTEKADNLSVEKDLESAEKQAEHASTASQRSVAADTPAAESDEGTENVVVVDFEPNDPEDPLNWPLRYKWCVTGMLATMSIIVNLSIVMCAPAVPSILAEFGSDSFAYQTLLVSIWELGEVFGPLVLAPFSELYGRRVVYATGCGLFAVLSVACALSTSLPMLVAFRFLIGMTPPTATLNSPILADMFPKEQRGRAISTVQLPGLLGTVLGPTVGSYLTASRGWRWTFWLSAMLCGGFEVIFFFCYRESYRVRILQRRTQRLRDETGDARLRSRYDTGRSRRQVFSAALVRPLRMLALSPVVWLLGGYAAVVYGYLFLILTTVGEVFQAGYGFSLDGLGLVYVGIGLGMMVAVVLCRSTLDRFTRSMRARAGVQLPEHRLPPMLLGGLVLPAGLFTYGWTAQHRVHPAVPIFATAMCGFGLTVTTIPSSTYIVDAFGVHAASAIAAMTVLKYATGTVLPLAGPPLYANLGVGWGNSVLGFIALALAPIPLLLIIFGERLRKWSRIQVTE